MTIRRIGKTANRGGMAFKPSLAEQKRQNLALLEAWAHPGMSDAGLANLKELRATVKPKRAMAQRQPSLIPLERDVNKEITSAAKQFDNVKLWRNNRGQVVLPSGGRLTYGVGPNGASDFIGYRSVTITPEMVGRSFAQFLAIEAKRPGKYETAEQLDFNKLVQDDGGQSGCAHSGEDAIEIMRRKIL